MTAQTRRGGAAETAAAPSIGLGSIVSWPDGYAMTLGRDLRTGDTARCCSGHKTPEEAKSHGISRALEIALANADRDIALWAEQEAVS